MENLMFLYILQISYMLNAKISLMLIESCWQKRSTNTLFLFVCLRFVLFSLGLF